MTCVLTGKMLNVKFLLRAHLSSLTSFLPVGNSLPFGLPSLQPENNLPRCRRAGIFLRAAQMKGSCLDIKLFAIFPFIH